MKETKTTENKLNAFWEKHKKAIIITFSAIGITLVGSGISKVIKHEPQKYSSRWFAQASDELLNAEREVVRQQYCSSGDNFRLASYLENLLRHFDFVIYNRTNNGTETGFPVPREHGWYLPNDN